MVFDFRRVVVLTGPYGSGKTELAIGLALEATSTNKRGRVALADLDVLKPYFRSREALGPLRAAGVSVIAPTGSLANSDLPIVPAELRGMVARQDVSMFLDVGGDPVGARALGSISDVVGASSHDLLLVLNRYRPFMDSLDQVVETAMQISSAAHLAITGIVSNTNLLEDTTIEDVMWGLDLARKVGAELGVPLRLLAVPDSLQGSLPSTPDLPAVLGVRRFMKPGYLGGVVLAAPSKTGSARIEE